MSKNFCSTRRITQCWNDEKHCSPRKRKCLGNRTYPKNTPNGLRQVENGNLPPMNNYSKKIIYKILRDHKTRNISTLNKSSLLDVFRAKAVPKSIRKSKAIPIRKSKAIRKSTPKFNHAKNNFCSTRRITQCWNDKKHCSPMREKCMGNQTYPKNTPIGLRRIRRGDLPPIDSYSKKIIYKILRDRQERNISTLNKSDLLKVFRGGPIQKSKRLIKQLEYSRLIFRMELINSNGPLLRSYNNTQLKIDRATRLQEKYFPNVRVQQQLKRLLESKFKTLDTKNFQISLANGPYLEIEIPMSELLKQKIREYIDSQKLIGKIKLEQNLFVSLVPERIDDYHY